VVEHAPGLRTEGYMMDFFGSGYDVADLMGLLPRLRKESYPFDEVRFVRRNGAMVSRIDYSDSRKRLDGRLLPLMRGDLEHALFDALADSVAAQRVDIRFGCSVEAAREAGENVEVTLTDGSAHTVDLLVGADGIHSRVRAMMFGPDDGYLRHLGYHTAAYVFTDPGLHDRMGGKFAMRSEPGRQAGFYPLRDGHVASFLVHQEPDPALPEDPRAVVRATYAGMG
jgi:2-polyprenyl-6-methoxyphenol hydroxylase-like FAD-dependent oxidoreductase